MTDPQTLIALGGALAVTQGAVSLGVGMLRDYIGNGRKQTNGFCKDHHDLRIAVENLVEAHKDEKQLELLTRAFKSVLNNGNENELPNIKNS